MNPIDVAPIPNQYRIALQEAYSESHRFYHNHEHISYMWRKYSTFGNQFSLTAILKIVYHDSYYQIGLGDGINEQKSRELFSKDSQQIGFNVHIHQDVCDFIDLTASHMKNSVDLLINYENSLLLDCDLASLAAEKKYFDKVNENITKEFMTKYSEEEVMKGRKKFFVNLLQKERIFMMVKDWENPARNNIKNWLNENGQIT